MSRRIGRRRRSRSACLPALRPPGRGRRGERRVVRRGMELEPVATGPVEAEWPEHRGRSATRRAARRREPCRPVRRTAGAARCVGAERNDIASVAPVGTHDDAAAAGAPGAEPPGRRSRGDEPPRRPTVVRRAQPRGRRSANGAGVGSGRPSSGVSTRGHDRLVPWRPFGFGPGTDPGPRRPVVRRPRGHVLFRRTASCHAAPVRRGEGDAMAAARRCGRSAPVAATSGRERPRRSRPRLVRASSARGRARSVRCRRRCGCAPRVAGGARQTARSARAPRTPRRPRPPAVRDEPERAARLEVSTDARDGAGPRETGPTTSAAQLPVRSRCDRRPHGSRARAWDPP